ANLTRVERNLIYLTMDQPGYYHIAVDHSLSKLAVILPLTDDYQVFWPASWDTSSYILFEPNTAIYLPKGKFLLALSFGSSFDLTSQEGFASDFQQQLLEPYACEGFSEAQSSFSVSLSLSQAVSDPDHSMYPTLTLNSDQLLHYNIIKHMDNQQSKVALIDLEILIEHPGNYRLTINDELKTFSAMVQRYGGTNHFETIGHISHEQPEIALGYGFHRIQLGIGADADHYFQQEDQIYYCQGCNATYALFTASIKASEDMPNEQYFCEYLPQTSADRTANYQVNRRAYSLLTDNAGNHTLDVLVHEKMADGIRTYTAATYPLTVLPADQGNTITVQQISDMIYVYETVDPLNRKMFMQVKAEAPSGIESIKWLNPPMICGSSQLVDCTMQSKDRTYFILAGSSAYRAMLAEKMQQVALQVNTHNGLSFKTDLSLNIHKDPAASVAIDPHIAELSIIGETSKAIDIN
ncbi:hypothetical protein MHK_007166, partial [Candidatus Magnetomorum sp. HK-1]